MPSSKQSDSPSVPTRLAKKQQSIGDRFLSSIFHVPEPDLFIAIKYDAKPEPYDWVLLSHPRTGCEMQLAIYDGQQEIFAVVEVMEFYKLQESEQWRPQIRSRFTNWLILVGLPFWADFIFGMIQ